MNTEPVQIIIDKSAAETEARLRDALKIIQFDLKDLLLAFLSTMPEPLTRESVAEAYDLALAHKRYWLTEGKEQAAA